MSSEQRRQGSELARRYARHFRVDPDDVGLVLREDEDCEVWARGVGLVWTLGRTPSPSTVAEAMATPNEGGDT